MVDKCNLCLPPIKFKVYNWVNNTAIKVYKMVFVFNPSLASQSLSLF